MAKRNIVSTEGRFVLTTSTAISPTWQRAMKEAVRDPAELCRLLDLPSALAAQATQADRLFSLFVPRPFLARMKRGDPHDPLLRQVWPDLAETLPVPGFSTDPVDDQSATLTPGLLQKYTGRVLTVTTGACAIHCRYCFRRHFPYGEAPKSLADWQPALDAVAADPTVDEVILSGGDPLTLTDARLAEFADRIAAIPHVRRLRVHTRMPIVIPQRVCDELLAWLRGTRLTPIMVVHANHPDELDDATGQALRWLVDAGVPTLNQAVLLRGVNDDADTLAELCRRLVDLRVLPYYLHQLDRVAGAAHFAVPEAAGLRMMEQLHALLPGYALPRYVREIAGAVGKEMVLPTAARL
ncbi:MAG: EF-P beta-lysylation protein EpmB [Pirellulales bacterium]